MHSQHLLRRRGGEWNVLLLGMVCALLSAAPASPVGPDVSNARYVMALAVLQQCSSTAVQTPSELTSPQVWRKHLPYLMTALHQMATPGGQQTPAALTISDTISSSRNESPFYRFLPSLPLFAVQRSGIPTTHFLN